MRNIFQAQLNNSKKWLATKASSSSFFRNVSHNGADKRRFFRARNRAKKKMCRTQRRKQSLPAVLERPVLQGIHNLVFSTSTERGPAQDRKRSPTLSKSKLNF